MKAAFYKNWKKIALVLTSVFWASCDDSTSATPDAIPTESSASVETSSSAEPASSTVTPSSNAEPASSTVTPSSSSSEKATQSSSTDNDAKIACTETTLTSYESEYSCIDNMCPEYGVIETSRPGVKCEDGTEYELQEMCPDYGIDMPCSTGFIGKDNIYYSEEEFKKIYRIAKPEPESSSSATEIVKPISSSDFNQITPKYGVIIDHIEQ